MDIYQEIWNADQEGSGVQPIITGTAGDDARGYVSVAARADGEDAKVLDRVLIPAVKQPSYDRVRDLFDNYALDEQDPEAETPEERQEVHDLLSAVIDTPPMQVARTYVGDMSGTPVSKDRWYAVLLEHWFRRFRQGGDPDLSGFEHVFVGEQEGPKVQGYHFWYKYYLDDGLASKIDGSHLPGFRDDRIVYLRGMYENGQENFPESVTISYRWTAPDYDRQALRPLTKPKGGFFVGCSVEGLMAIGSVRAHLGARAPKEAVINGGRYDLKLYRSPDDQHIRTFYPVYLGPAGAEPSPPSVAPAATTPVVTTSSPIRILAALVNPEGVDEGKETVTLLNAGSTTASLEGWFLVDKRKNRFAVGPVSLPAGTATTILLPRHSIQLSNQGGEIRLVNRDGHTAHVVAYSKAQAREQGRTILF